MRYISNLNAVDVFRDGGFDRLASNVPPDLALCNPDSSLSLCLLHTHSLRSKVHSGILDLPQAIYAFED